MNSIVERHMMHVKKGEILDLNKFEHDCQVTNKSYKSPVRDQYEKTASIIPSNAKGEDSDDFLNEE